MHFFVDHLAVQYLEGIEVDAFVQREDGVADVGVVGQPQVFLGRTGWRSRVRVPVGQDFQTVSAGVFQGGELVARGKGEMFRGVVDVLHPEVFGHGVVRAQQVATRFVRCVLLGLTDDVVNDVLFNLHN